MRVAIISKSDSFGGGASAIAEVLAEELNRDPNYTTIHINLWRGSENPLTRSLVLGRGLVTKIARKLEQLTGYVDMLPVEVVRLIFILRKFKPDVVHFHDLTSAITPFSVKLISKMYPTAWTLHDMSSMTAGCLYVADCQSWAKGCGNCPQLGIWPLSTKKDKTKNLRRYRERLLNDPRVHLVTPSEWLQRIVKSQLKHNKVVQHIDNGVSHLPLNFTMINQQRIEMLLKPDIPIILIMAGDINDDRKGYSEALKVLNDLPLQRIKFQIIVMGKVSADFISKLPKTNFYIAGFISDQKRKLEIIATSDILIFMSKQDNQPLTVLEALVQGVTVLGYSTGGVREIARRMPHVSVVEPGDHAGVKKLIIKKINHRASDRDRLQFSMIARNEYSQSIFVEKHKLMYEKMRQDLN